MIKLTLLFVFVTVAYIQCAPTYISPVETEVEAQHNDQVLSMEQSNNPPVQLTISPNERRIYYQWLAFLKSSTSTTSNNSAKK